MRLISANLDAHSLAALTVAIPHKSGNRLIMRFTAGECACQPNDNAVNHLAC